MNDVPQHIQDRHTKSEPSISDLDAYHFSLSPGNLSWEQIQRLVKAIKKGYWPNVKLTPSKQQEQRVKACSEFVQTLVKDKTVTYGVNTGFGLLASQSIESDQLELLQRKLVLSHAAGVGKPMPLEVVYLATLLKINALSQGFSGVRAEVIERLVLHLNKGILAKIPEKGSVGASGDLAPLAHLSLTLIGEGECWYQERWMPTKEVLAQEGITPLILGPKEGLALLNGTQISTAYALKAALSLEHCVQQGLVMGAMSVEAAKGSRVPFDDRIHALRNQPAQRSVAKALSALLPPSEIAQSHEGCHKVQDPYSLRCQPQVMGACLHQLLQAKTVLLDEANGVSDNPLVFVDEQEALSGGNFHAEPVAMAADNMALAFAEVGALSERRLALLMDHHLSELPPFLVKNSGLNSGFMIAQVTAAALVSENKQLATPSSVDSLPTSANQEDHVSMATYAARRLSQMAENTQHTLAIEWLAAAQGCDIHLPLKPAAPIQKAISLLREKVPFLDEDRVFSLDIEAAKHMLDQGTLLDSLEQYVDSLASI